MKQSTQLRFALICSQTIFRILFPSRHKNPSRYYVNIDDLFTSIRSFPLTTLMLMWCDRLITVQETFLQHIPANHEKVGFICQMCPRTHCTFTQKRGGKSCVETHSSKPPAGWSHACMQFPPATPRTMNTSYDASANVGVCEAIKSIPHRLLIYYLCEVVGSISKYRSHELRRRARGCNACMNNTPSSSSYNTWTEDARGRLTNFTVVYIRPLCFWILDLIDYVGLSFVCFFKQRIR